MSPLGRTRREEVVSAAITMSAVLVSFGVAYGTSRVVALPRPDLVLAVVLVLTLSRTLSRSDHVGRLVLVEVPVLGVAATGAGWLMLHEPWVGQPMLVTALCLGVLARRWDGLPRQAGRLVALPFLALLITPVPRVPGADPVPLTPASLCWGAAVGLLAAACALAAQRVRSTLCPSLVPLPSSTRRRRPGRLDAGTRAAIQLLLALGVALTLGHLLFGRHWPWTVLSAYLVMSSARGRGDVVHRAGMRVLGAAAGTAAATALTVHGLPAGNRWLVLAVFVVMTVALVLRERSYAYWAAGVTGMIALLDGFYGEQSAQALPDRVLGVLVGATVGVAVAWFVAPTRTCDVLRLYLAATLAALTDDLSESDPQRPPRTPGALRTLDELGPTLRTHRRTFGRGTDPHATDAVAAVHRLADLPVDGEARRRLRRDVVRVRRAIVGEDDPSPAELPPDLAVVHGVLRATREAQRIGAGA